MIIILLSKKSVDVSPLGQQAVVTQVTRHLLNAVILSCPYAQH